MAVADITVNEKWATIECDDSPHRIVIDSTGASIVNVGAKSVFLSMLSGGDLERDGLQHNGEIQLDPNDSVPVPVDASFVRHQCLTAEITKLWFVPRAG